MGKFDNFTKSFQAAFNKVKFKTIQHSPEILVVTGVVGTVVAFGLAIKATRKLDDILEDGNKQIAAAKETGENKELAKAYGGTVLNVGKLYAPAGITLGFSLAAILGSHHILQKRNVAITAAYTALDKAYKEYQSRVSDKLGEEAEKELRYGITKEKAEEETVDENGKKKKVKSEHNVFDGKEHGPYAKFFDEASRNWERDPELNLMFLRREERYWNDILRRDGYVFLCDVYKSLDIDETKASRTVGWIYDPNGKENISYIDFGLYNAENRRFVNGYEPSILLDFNCDGIIINKVNYPG